MECQFTKRKYLQIIKLVREGIQNKELLQIIQFKNGQRTRMDISLKNIYKLVITKMMLNIISHREMLIKITPRYFLIPTMVAKSNRQHYVSLRMEKLNHIYSCLNCKIVCQFLKMLNLELQYDPQFSFLGVYLRELKAYKILYTYIHCSIINNSPKWKQPKCSSTDEWINKIWSICTIQLDDKKEQNTGTSYTFKTC